MNLFNHLGRWLRNLADDIDPDYAPRMTSWSFTFEPHLGIHMRQDGHGCPLWYIGHKDFDRAHTEADKP